DEVVRVAGRVEPPAPADEGHARVLVLLLERDDVVEELGLEIHGDVGLRELGLDELRGLQRRRVARRDEELELERALPDLRDELLGAVRVSLWPRLEARVVREVRGRDRTPADEADALGGPLVHDLVATYRHREGLDVAVLVEDEARRLVRHHAVPAERSNLLVGQR